RSRKLFCKPWADNMGYCWSCAGRALLCAGAGALAAAGGAADGGAPAGFTLGRNVMRTMPSPALSPVMWLVTVVELGLSPRAAPRAFWVIEAVPESTAMPLILS